MSGGSSAARSARGRCVLVTGGAGYIGSHVVLALMAAGWRVLVVDDLSTGQRRLLPSGAELHVGNVGDTALMTGLMRETQPVAVMHFAGSISVPESVANPLKYYTNNFSNSGALVEACTRAGVSNFIFSSTAAVYGIPKIVPVSESAQTDPINPYGRSKLMTEHLLADTAAAGGLSYVALRYFNVAGADAHLRSGQVVRNSTNLIKTVSELAAGARAEMTVHGTDYPTADGTCVRDFIHVSDLADAHVKALDYLCEGGDSLTMNCGYGHGYSVREVLAAAARVVGRPLPHSVGPRRAGDPPEVIADAGLIRQTLGWAPARDDLDLILRSAIGWEMHLQSPAQAVAT